MKKLFILTLCVTTLIYLIPSSPKVEPPTPALADAPVAVVEAPQATVAPEPVPESIPVVETVVEPTINQAQAGVTYSPNDCEQYRPILSKYNWDVNVAMAIMKAESGCRHEAFNPEWHRGCQGSRGLFQIACVHHDSTFDPEANIAAAYRIYSARGSWRDWGAYLNGSYTRYL